MSFIGSINAETRKWLGNNGPAFDGRQVYVGCSGNFTVSSSFPATLLRLGSGATTFLFTPAPWGPTWPISPLTSLSGKKIINGSKPSWRTGRAKLPQ